MATKPRWIPQKSYNIFFRLRGGVKPPYVSFGLDVALAALSLPAALGLRLGDAFGAYPGDVLLKQILGFTLLAMGSFFWTQSYQGAWRTVSVPDLIRLIKAVLLSMALFLPFLLLSNGFDEFPQSAWVIQGMLLISFLGGVRFIYRATAERFGLSQGKLWGKRGLSPSTQARALLIGTGEIAESFLREVYGRRAPPFQIVGLLSVKTPPSQGKFIQGIEVLGSVAQWDEIIENLRHKHQLPDLMIVADGSLRRQKLNDLLRKMETFSAEWVRLPSLEDLRNPREIRQLRTLKAEDFLGEGPRAIDAKGLLEFIKGKRVLITGAGGTIGGELLRQLGSLSPAHITLLDQNELLLFQAQAGLKEQQPYLSQKAILGDVRQKESLFQVIAEEKPDWVFHAAALKHAVFGKNQPFEAILTNVLGTCYVADACLAHHVEGMIFVSTDQAANPYGLIAATKRLAESYCQALDALARQEKARTRFVSIRFNQVLASPGSVIPLFARQIAKGGPVTVPHPQMKRPLLSLQETVGLFLQAATMGVRSENIRGNILALDMGEPVSILELAETMIRLAGFVPHRDIAVAFTGEQPGEEVPGASIDIKAFEPMEGTPQIWVGKPKVPSHASLLEALKDLGEAVQRQDKPKAFKLLKKLVPECQASAEATPSGTSTPGLSFSNT
ncbi:MAG: polysaccharide biosynthesis protein [Alphaproteobacteria bacterium]